MGLISTIITNKKNQQIAKDTNKTNLLLAEKQNQWNLEQWNRENEYNDPSKQMERLAAAGLSRAGAANAVDGGNSAHLESADMANQQPYKLDSPNVEDTISTAMNLASGIQGLKAGSIANKFNQETLLTREKLLDAQLNRDITSLQQSMQLFPYQREAAAHANKSAIQKHRENDLLNLKHEEELKKFRTENKWLDGMKAKEWATMDTTLEKIQQDINESRARIQGIAKQGEYINSQIKVNGMTEELQKQQYKHNETMNALKESNFGYETEIAKVNAALHKFGLSDNAAGKAAALFVGGVYKPSELVNIFKGMKKFKEFGDKSFNGSASEDFWRYVMQPDEVVKDQTRQGWLKSIGGMVGAGIGTAGAIYLGKGKAAPPPPQIVTPVNPTPPPTPFN